MTHSSQKFTTVLLLHLRKLLPVTLSFAMISAFVVVTAPSAQAAEVDREGYYLANAWQSTSQIRFIFGNTEMDVYFGDWDGDGVDTPAIRMGRTFYIRNSLSAGQADKVFVYGRSSDEVVVGDWDGDGVDTVGVRRGSTFYLTNDPTYRGTRKVVEFSRTSDEILVGDWDGNGVDTLGARRGSVFYLTNSPSAKGSRTILEYGRNSDSAFAGDWDGDGVDTLGVRRGASFYLTNSPSVRGRRTIVDYGRTSDQALVGDWDGDGVDGPGVSRSKTTSGTVNSTFEAGNIISNSLMFNPDTMDLVQVQSFLDEKGSDCEEGTDGSACLKDYRTESMLRLSAPYCNSINVWAGQSAAKTIVSAAQACGVNPQVLLVMLQKEQGLVTTTNPSETRYNKAMGFRCPDNQECLAEYQGFEYQVYGAASRLVQYGEEPESFTYQSRETASVAYNPTASCGSSSVYIENRATAALYNYTPYQPNKAALSNLYGAGDSCSTYGNRNFWRMMRDWFA